MSNGAEEVMIVKLEKSKHSEMRGQQRSFRKSDSEIIDLYGDETQVGNKCSRVSISQNELDGLVADEIICRQVADRLRKKYKVQSGDKEVTVANACGSKRKNYKKWKNGKSLAVLKGKIVMGFY